MGDLILYPGIHINMYFFMSSEIQYKKIISTIVKNHRVYNITAEVDSKIIVKIQYKENNVRKVNANQK